MKNTLTKEQIKFLRKGTKKCGSEWSFNEKTGLVDIEGDFEIEDTNKLDISKRLKTFQGIKFGVVTGNFHCSFNELTSLEGAPKKVGGSFECKGNKLTSLEGAPKEVKGYFDCSLNQLTNLEGSPKKVGGGFECDHNKLTSLVGAPQKVGQGFDCSYNQLASLVGAPQVVKGGFYCSYNQLTSLIGAPQEVGTGFNCSNNQLTNLEGAPQKVGEDFRCKNNLIGDELLELIWERIKTCPNYKIAINSVKREILNIKQKELAEIDSKYEILISQLDNDDLSNGASLLGRIGVF